jgi:hypothetical protein
MVQIQGSLVCAVSQVFVSLDREEITQCKIQFRTSAGAKADHPNDAFNGIRF